MLKLINTKVLLSILAVLLAIAGLLVHENRVSERQAADAAKARAILEQQQKKTNDQEKQDEAERQRLNEMKRRSRSFDGGGSGVKYIP